MQKGSRMLWRPDDVWAGSDFLQAAPGRAIHEKAKLKYPWRNPRVLEMIGPWESLEENDEQ